MILKKYITCAGINPETHAIGNLLNYYGVLAPHSKEPYSEALLFGLGGGIAFGYFVFQYEGHDPHLYIGTRYLWHDPYRYYSKIAESLGGTLINKTTSSKSVAEKYLLEAIREEAPAIVQVDAPSLSYYGLPSTWAGAMPTVVTVYGVDSGTAYIHDTSSVPFKIKTSELASARNRSKKMKNSLFTLIPPKREPDIRNVVLKNLKDIVRNELDPGLQVKGFKGNLGLKGLNKWLQLVSSEKDVKSWRKVFRNDSSYYTGMKSLFNWIELAGTGGSGSRTQFADFLDEVSEILSNKELSSCADRYRLISGLWSEIVNLLLPDGNDLFAHTKELMIKKAGLFVENGPDALPVIRKINAELDEISSLAEADFPLDEEEKEQIFSTVSDKLSTLVREEESGLQQIGKALV